MFEALAGAFGDIIEGIRLAPLWMSLGWTQTVTRFRRTLLGPFWLSANLLAISFALALVFGAMLGSDYRATFAPLIAGILVWNLLGVAYAEAPMVFIGAASLMHSQRLPLSFHVFLLMYRMFINFAAQLLTMWAVLFLMHLGGVPNWRTLVGLPMVLYASFLVCLVIAIPSTRYRDFGQLVMALVQLLFFLTPVFWTPSQMSRRQQFLVTYNPLAHLLEILREPLLGRVPTAQDWIWSAGTCVGLTVIVVIVLARFRKRVVFWL